MSPTPLLLCGSAEVRTTHDIFLPIDDKQLHLSVATLFTVFDWPRLRFYPMLSSRSHVDSKFHYLLSNDTCV